MVWIPTITEWSGPVYKRIVDVLEADIASGLLTRGQQLPTHRALARALGIDLTTVTRAYGEARRRGLLDAKVGQGTFVSETTARAAADIPYQVKIDLSMNVPPQPVEANLETRIAQGLSFIQTKPVLRHSSTISVLVEATRNARPLPSGCGRACPWRQPNA
jgi:DNA-binding transcriptional regulator YhcF (GntR family)